MKRDMWTERGLRDLPAEEPDKFERKSGKLFENLDNFLNQVAKALSAFANSGGGSLILGVQNDGMPDGIPPMFGGATIRDWVEQKVPHLLDYPLSDLRVHTVIRDDPSQIPNGREVVVIDVGDSASAPHQSKRDHVYYYRVGGRSLPAPHFYLELLRQRLTNPALKLELIRIAVAHADEFDGGIYVGTTMQFRVQNVGRAAAYEWQVRPSEYNLGEAVPAERQNECKFFIADYPTQKPRPVTIATGSRTILPGCSHGELLDFGFQLRPAGHTVEAVREDIEFLLRNSSISYRLATETSPGELISIALSPYIDVEEIEAAIRRKCLQFYHI